ncbi:uncharacterized protein C8Q71DRAFT_715391, partial [Rhodofomes roseus]
MQTPHHRNEVPRGPLTREDKDWHLQREVPRTERQRSYPREGVRVSFPPGVGGSSPSSGRTSHEYDYQGMHSYMQGSGSHDEAPSISAMNIAGPVHSMNRSLDHCLDMIEEMVGEDPDGETPSYLRTAKMDKPSTWSGTDDLYAFEEWLFELLMFFAVLHITGPRLDRDRVQIAGNSLADSAKDWYFCHVQSPRRSKRQWSFAEAIMALHRRFIHQDGEIKAIESWSKVTYHKSGGVTELLDKMTQYADRMAERPGDYEWKRRFLTALPSEMEETLRKVYFITPERSPFGSIVQAASRYEFAMQSAAASRTAQTNTMTKDGSGALRKFATQLSSRTRATGQSTRFSSRPSALNTGYTKPPPTSTAVVVSDKSLVKHAAPSGKATTPASGSTVICWSCGEQGHTTRDKDKCKNGGRLPPRKTGRMNAARIVEDDGTDSAEEYVHVEPVPTDHTDQPVDVQSGEEAEVTDYPQSEYGGSQYAYDD